MKRAPSGPLADVVVVLATYLVLGVLGAVAWWLLWDPAMFTKVNAGGAMGEVELAKRFDADAWYAVLAAGSGLVAGSVLMWWRRRDYLLTTALIVVGAGVAAVLMALLGGLLGPPDPDPVLAAAKAGVEVPVRLEVTAKATYLVWPIASMIGALIVLWSSSKDRRAQEPSRVPPESSHATLG